MRIRHVRALPESHSRAEEALVGCDPRWEAQTVTALLLCIPMIVVAAGAALPVQETKPAATGPETFHVTVTVTGKEDVTGQVTVPMTIQINRYTPEHARAAMLDGFKRSGYPGFLLALRDSPIAGFLELRGQKSVIRWAHQEPNGAGRKVTIVTDKPVYFIGLGKPGAKPTAGYEVGVLRLDLDNAGKGDGIMAAAARVKRSGESAVQIDDYAETPLKLTMVPSGASR